MTGFELQISGVGSDCTTNLIEKMELKKKAESGPLNKTMSQEI